MTNPNERANEPEVTTATTWTRVVSRRRLFALAGGAAVLAACSRSSAQPADTTMLETTTEPSTTSTTSTTLAPTTTIAPTTTTLPPPVQPLTGLPLTDEALLQRVALIVKISNDRGARPQTGLNEADIVYEAWGAGPTRFAAVYHSQDADFVGPIRSCREQDVNLVGSFNRAVFACSGGNSGNIALLRNSDMLLITEGKGPGWGLDPNRRRPHKTHADTAQLRTNAGPDRTGPEQQFHYRAADERAAGDPMTGFDLQIQQVFVQWRYDAPSKRYLREQDGRPHLMADGTQVTSDNVVIAWLDYYPSSTDRRSPDGRSTGSGAAMVFTGGRLVIGTWTRADRLDPFAFTADDGDLILLAPGRTFIELPNSGGGTFRGQDTYALVG
jgi:hypothetical protein